MPTYEYVCTNCKHGFEEFQSITAKPLKTCPACGKPRLQRLIGTGAGILFKGSGFYETDYRSESYRKAAEAEKKGTAPAGDSKTDSGGDAKPAAPVASPAEKNTASTAPNTGSAPEKPAAKRKKKAS